MVRLVALIALAGCGRFGFDAATDAAADADRDATVDVLLGHDEDGDGVPDDVDTCPHIVAPQDDGDGDRVGDACDPRPTLAGDQILRFDTMTGTHPFTVSGFTTAAIVQQLDALAVTGMPQGNDVYAGLSMPFVVGSVRVAIGIDVTAVNSGAPSGQNQIALAIHAAPPNYFVELNQNLPTFDVASVTYYDGNNFNQADARDLATGIHTGPLFLQTTQTVGTGVVLDVGWPGELYRAQVLDNLYQGATDLEINLNNVNLEIRYLLVITSP